MIPTPYLVNTIDDDTMNRVLAAQVNHPPCVLVFVPKREGAVAIQSCFTVQCQVSSQTILGA